MGCAGVPGGNGWEVRRARCHGVRVLHAELPPPKRMTALALSATLEACSHIFLSCSSLREREERVQKLRS